MPQGSTDVFVSASNYLTTEGIIALVDNLPAYKPYSVLVEVVSEHLMSTSESIAILEFSNVDELLLSRLRSDFAYTSNRVLLVVNNVSKHVINQLMQAGFKNIITKCCDREEIVRAIDATARLEPYLCQCVLEELTKVDEPQTELEESVLSPRELQVLVLIADGLKTNEIADKLYVSVHTINSHRKNMLKKLNLKSPIELIVYAMEKNIISKSST